MTTITMTSGPLRLSRSTAENLDAVSANAFRVAVANYMTRQLMVGTTALTDSSGGAASGTSTVAPAPVAVGAAVSGSNLAPKATTEAALVTVINALSTLIAKVNTSAVKAGLPLITDSSGGTSGGNTVAAVTTAIAGGALGVPVAAFNALVVTLNTAFYEVAMKIRHLSMAVGNTGVSGIGNVKPAWSDTYGATVAAISTNTGTAVTPGVTAVEATATLTAFQVNVATLAAVLNACFVQLTVSPIVVSQ